MRSSIEDVRHSDPPSYSPKGNWRSRPSLEASTCQSHSEGGPGTKTRGPTNLVIRRCSHKKKKEICSLNALVIKCSNKTYLTKHFIGFNPRYMWYLHIQLLTNKTIIWSHGVGENMHKRNTFKMLSARNNNAFKINVTYRFSLQREWRRWPRTRERDLCEKQWHQYQRLKCNYSWDPFRPIKNATVFKQNAKRTRTP